MKVVGLRTCLWKRETITRHLLRHYEEIAGQLESHGIRLVLIAVHSQDQAYVDRVSDGLARWGFIRHRNRPIWDKLRTGLQALREWDPIFCVNIGADDFMGEGSLRKMLREFEDGADFTGWSSAYIANRRLGVKYWPGYPRRGPRFGEPFGPGRGLSRRLLDRIDWNPWMGAPDRNLDGTYWKRVKALCPDADMRFRSCAHWGPFVDVKDSESFTPWAKTARYNKTLPRDQAQEILESVGLGDLLTGGIYG